MIPSYRSAFLKISFDPEAEKETSALFLQKLTGTQQLHVPKLVKVDGFFKCEIEDVNQIETLAYQVVHPSVERRHFVVDSVKQRNVYRLFGDRRTSTA